MEVGGELILHVCLYLCILILHVHLILRASQLYARFSLHLLLIPVIKGQRKMLLFFGRWAQERRFTGEAPNIADCSHGVWNDFSRNWWIFTFLLCSFMGKGLIKLKPTVVWQALRDHMTRHAYDKMVKVTENLFLQNMQIPITISLVTLNPWKECVLYHFWGSLPNLEERIGNTETLITSSLPRDVKKNFIRKFRIPCMGVTRCPRKCKKCIYYQCSVEVLLALSLMEALCDAYTIWPESHYVRVLEHLL